MLLSCRSSFLLISFLALSACGGGGGGDGGNSSNSGGGGGPTNNTPTPTQVIANATDYSATELKSAATELMGSRYTGQKNVASINLDVAQRAFKYLFDDDATETPFIADDNFTDQMDGNGNIDITFACDYQGTAKYKGKLNSAYQGNLAITYTNCNDVDNGFPITGSIALSIQTLTETEVDITYYFDNLGWTFDEQSIKLTGYSDFYSSQYDNDQNYSLENHQHVLFIIDDQQLLMDAQLEVVTVDYQDSFDLTGELFIGEEGKIAFSLEDAVGTPPFLSSGSVLLEADKLVAFDFGSDLSSNFIRYLEDTDSDGTYDIGTYFSNVSELLYGSVTAKTLVSVEMMSIPPTVDRPYLNNYDEITTTTAINLSPGFYNDPDNSSEDLTLSYRWYINNILVSEQTADTFPPYLAVYGDIVKAAMVVSDGVNSIEGVGIEIYIQDAPAELRVSDVPENIRAGDVVKFNVTAYDPDLGVDEAAANLLVGPEGAVIDTAGQVTWHVPSDFSFSQQFYDFTFSLPNDDETTPERIVVPIEVSAEEDMPLARSGITVPTNSKSIQIADFDGDTKNEILSTDNLYSLFLLEFNEQKYQQKWVYPYKLPTDGRIVQVLKANLDDDAQQEIVVITERGVSVINELDQQASILFETTDYLHFASVIDIDGDGTLEIAFLSAQSTYSDTVQLHVVSLNNPDVTLFTTNLDSAKQIEFANVDADSNLELVTNNGRVYDAITWQNQWLNGTEFGDSHLTTGDFDGDGIAEIAGADNWGNISLYSAVDKSQLYSFDNFNTCTLLSEDLNNDGIDELVVGDCQWGNITVYNLIDNDLSKLWEVDSQDHGSSSLVSGDSDNDGQLELHWGTGITHSGQNIFVVADIDGDSLTVKDTSGAVQLDYFSSAGWSKIEDNDEKAVFFVPSTLNGYGGGRVLSLHESGEFLLSDEISSNWSNNRYAVTTDFNNDGFGDIFLPSTELYDGALSVIQLSDYSTIWQIAGDYNSDIGIIRAKDLNDDGFDDAVYVDGQALKAVDVQNQSIIANYTFDHSIRDFVATSINDTGVVLVSFGDKMSFLTTNGSFFSEQSFIDESCMRIELFNFDSDAELELACLQAEQYSSYSQTLVVYELNDNRFTEVARNKVDSEVYDLAIDPTSETNQDIFVTTSKRINNNIFPEEYLYQIKKLSSQGKIRWSSPGLIGQPSSHGLKVRLGTDQKLEFMLSTSQMMYWIK
ncbi:FG-GAP repeat domain-containing protein [Aliiglaciecola lipolytica]|uniref:FG-GAP repeat domain-containing protein n=1 Tax=Aliiglaciecola lipolytica TaxID=477689 RepID=UPI001C09982A|nr:VCBS repeat-containing protein [Aliiglaciecola lipolytica]MBU2879441.1 VCBS repeat-containing protein [Aliiglaciecola lipolytica]